MTTRPAFAMVAGLPVLSWRLPTPWLSISSAVLGGGIGERHWACNATVRHDYDRPDPAVHLTEIGTALGCAGSGVGLLTAVDVRDQVTRVDHGVSACVTTGVGKHPTWAAAPESEFDSDPATPGTVNAVCLLPVRLTEGALVNAIATVAEAKAQAFREVGVPGTGTCTDATIVLCPPDGEPERYGGPRSRIGGALARAVHAAVRTGLLAPEPRLTPWPADVGSSPRPPGLSSIVD
ncbi:adenosylcobinamide amidohydrolase [Actinoalloteichus hoggarensis]|uniref:Adenosylcobinamide amidohydrolase n=1 Tax=Actinoalloteichus hoggarensis TaxID=1470176 RepID=A0A221WA00_9PSEU|nr:adenosylcobinamide amidohydrolase [Actinoalloteichus hoggarensis]ASO22554.1 Adenosylcobinamide amidohydrolase [Actinoalloteichus hoggarensis]MBB5923022.1 adenosylcobinamide amidohydrolase [Actinoalloteichus hoggarensis]